MITTETPYKLAEIIRDTWPNLYNPPKKSYNNSTNDKQNGRDNRRNAGTTGNCDTGTWMET